MRGLLFTGGKQPDMRLALPYCIPYSYVVAADSGITGAEDAGIVPDLIVGDMDSVPDASVLSKYPAEKIRRWPEDKDFTDTEIALHILAEKEIDEVILIGGSGGRMDHFFALKALFDGAAPPFMWIGEESLCITVEAGTHASGISVAGLDGKDAVSVFPAGKGKHACRSRGFHWDIDGLDWGGGCLSLSNRADSGSLSIESVTGRFLVVVPLRPDIRLEKHPHFSQ